jgi:hypothetical protein
MSTTSFARLPRLTQTLARLVPVVQRAHPDWSQVDCETDVLHDSELYRRYVQESSAPLERTAPSARHPAEPVGAQAEVMRRGEALAKSAGLSLNDAVAKVLHDDPALYWQYAKQDDSAPGVSADHVHGFGRFNLQNPSCAGGIGRCGVSGARRWPGRGALGEGSGPALGRSYG